MRMKKAESIKKINMITALMLCMLLIVGTTACGQTNTENKTSDTQQTEAALSESTGPEAEVSSESAALTESEVPETSVQETAEVHTDENAGESVKDTLVVVFSATGTTKGVADKIAAITDADIYEIKAAEPYSDADLNWNDSSSRSTKEQNDSSVRPEIGSETISLEGYKTIFIGYPIWWASIPMPIASFLEEYDFSGKQIIPFCSHGGGRFGQSLTAIAKLAPDANMGEGLSVHYSGGSSLPEDIADWLKTNGIEAR